VAGDAAAIYDTAAARALPPAPNNRPTPLGVIRFVGEVDRDTPVDLLLTIATAARSEATWPKAQVRPGRILWNNVFTDDGAKTADLDAKHWMTPLRQTASATIKAGPQAERFLLYDVALGYKFAAANSKPTKTARSAPATAARRHCWTSRFIKAERELDPRDWYRRSTADPVRRSRPTQKKTAGPTSQPDPTAAFDSAATPTPKLTGMPAATLHIAAVVKVHWRHARRRDRAG